MKSEVLLRFLGRGWRIERTIDDHLRGETYAFRGRTRGSLVARGVLNRGHDSWTMRRVYRLRAVEGAVHFCFDNGLLFFEIDCERLPRVEISHACAPDIYRGALALNNAGWTLTWNILGPAKDMTIKSTYF